MDTPSSQHNIAIVGAGIGGLALAHALHRFGFSITLLEQTRTLSEVGAGLGLWENGLDALATIGLRDAVMARGLPWPAYEIHRPNKRTSIKNNRILSKDGTAAPLMIKRGALFGVLKDALAPSIKIVTGFKVAEVAGHTLTADDGRQVTADVIIGADGAQSVVRKQITSKTPKFRQQICFRGIAFGISGHDWTAAEVYDARKHRVGYFQLPGDEAYWFDITDSDMPYGDFDAVRDELKALNPLLSRLIDKTPPTSILCHPIEDMPPVTTPHSFIALIGDAAHPLQPSLGQGACLAMEDAVILADCLGANMDSPAKGIELYLSKRQKRWMLYFKLCQQLGTGALDKGKLGRQLAILRMVHTPEWSLSMFGRSIFAFER